MIEDGIEYESIAEIFGVTFHQAGADTLKALLDRAIDDCVVDKPSLNEAVKELTQVGLTQVATIVAEAAERAQTRQEMADSGHCRWHYDWVRSSYCAGCRAKWQAERKGHAEMVQLTVNSTRAWTIVAADSSILQSEDFPPEKLEYLHSVLSCPHQREQLRTDPDFLRRFRERLSA